MSSKTQNERIIFGLKVKQRRQELQLSFAELAGKAKMSVSYLNEIEKGKKFPKEPKLQQLAAALDVSVAELTSPELSRNLAPINELLQSNFLNELPLDLFGIELSKVVEIIANAPVRVGAFISTLLELSRNYAVKEENFYFGALRAYLELNHNYFAQIEKSVDQFRQQYEVSDARPLPVRHLQELLETHYRYRIIENGLDPYPELHHLRSVYIPDRRELLLNRQLTDGQRAFQFGKELAFQHMEIKERAFTSSLLRISQFEEVLNHARATYFSVALHMPLQQFTTDIRSFFQHQQWDSGAFLTIMKAYGASPEMFYHRLTNVLPEFFKLTKLFFLRFTHDPVLDHFNIDKELHLDRRHHPHSNGLSEHYCRRWIALSLLEELDKKQHRGQSPGLMVAAQRSRYYGTQDEYLCLTIARPNYPDPSLNVSVTLGLQITEQLKQTIRFWNDPDIPDRVVNKTCERCAIQDCAERAAPPVVIERRRQFKLVQQRLQELVSGALVQE